MSALVKPQQISVDDYLAGELVSQVKHEYLGGYVYAMAGARNAHNQIAGNLFARLHARLRGDACQPFNSDTKVRVKLPTHVRFYYPDVSVVCEPNPPEDSFQDRPVIIVEVLSNKTRRIDQGEKKDAYFTISTLSAYLLVEQDSAVVNLYRRTEKGFAAETYSELTSVIPLTEVNVELQSRKSMNGLNSYPSLRKRSRNMAVAEDKVREALKAVVDPELFVNIVDLGLIYDIKVDEQPDTKSSVAIEMTMTSPACPAGPQLLSQSQDAVRRLDGVGEVDVKLVMEPPWTPDRMTEDARDQLGIF
jgi:metal-sulfur cluster biosynthetic enzyme/Uma2 family endonuclease